MTFYEARFESEVIYSALISMPVAVSLILPFNPSTTEAFNSRMCFCMVYIIFYMQRTWFHRREFLKIGYFFSKSV
jgi:hypothetical protein